MAKNERRQQPDIRQLYKARRRTVRERATKDNKTPNDAADDNVVYFNF